MTSNRDDARLDGLEVGGKWLVEHQDGVTIIAERGHRDSAWFARLGVGSPLHAALHALVDARARIAELEAELRAVHEGGVFTAGEMDEAIANARREGAEAMRALAVSLVDDYVIAVDDTVVERGPLNKIEKSVMDRVRKILVQLRQRTRALPTKGRDDG